MIAEVVMNKCIVRLASVAIVSVFVISQAAATYQVRSAPFDVGKRPMPSGSDLSILVPETVGPFKREALPADANARSDQDLNVTYKAGSDSIFFGFSIPETANDAYEAVKVTREEAIASKVDMKGEHYVVGKDPSYFKVKDFMSWTRGRYFFYAKASSAAALEKFMSSFPF
jgi:hypothetical protein